MEGICAHISTPFVSFHFVFLWETREEWMKIFMRIVEWLVRCSHLPAESSKRSTPALSPVSPPAFHLQPLIHNILLLSVCINSFPTILFPWITSGWPKCSPFISFLSPTSYMITRSQFSHGSPIFSIYPMPAFEPCWALIVATFFLSNLKGHTFWCVLLLYVKLGWTEMLGNTYSMLLVSQALRML